MWNKTYKTIIIEEIWTSHLRSPFVCKKLRMYLELKLNYIIRMLPSKPMLIDTEEDDQILISQLESVILSMLDGTKTEEMVQNDILSELQITSEKEKKTVIDNISNIVDHFSPYIDIREKPSKRSAFVYGDLSQEIPYELSIELTDRCLLECKHCYKEAGNYGHKFINTERLIDFLRKVKNKVHTIQLTGGEAMMHPEFEIILNYCKNNFNEVVVSTTGLLINRDNVDCFKGTRVYISLYSFDPLENEEYVGKDVLEKILSAIKLLKRKEIHVCINTIVSNRNVENLSQFINKCEELQVDGVGLGKNTLVGRAKNLNYDEHCSDNCELCVRKIEESFMSDKMYLSTFISDTLPNELRCGCYKWIINEEENIMPCAFFPKDFSLGNISDPIESILNQEKYNEMIEKLIKWAKELKLTGESITDVCEALYLVDEM